MKQLYILLAAVRSLKKHLNLRIRKKADELEVLSVEEDDFTFVIDSSLFR